MIGVALNRQAFDLLVIGDADRSLLSRLSPASTTQIPFRFATSADRKLTASHIDHAVLESERAVLLVAQGAACMAAAWWTRLSPRSYVARIAGALLVAPERDSPRALTFTSPASKLPYPTIVVGADDASQTFAMEWGSRLIDGPLPSFETRPSRRLQTILSHFTKAIVERDIRTAERLMAAIGDQ
jgi:hypothetical protein